MENIEVRIEALEKKIEVLTDLTAFVLVGTGKSEHPFFSGKIKECFADIEIDAQNLTDDFF